MKLSELLDEDNIVIELSAKDKRSVLERRGLDVSINLKSCSVREPTRGSLSTASSDYPSNCRGPHLCHGYQAACVSELVREFVQG